MKHTAHSGYIGMIGLLVSIAIIALLFTGEYFSPRQTDALQEVQPKTASGTIPLTEVGQMHADVDAANALRDTLNAKNKETNALMVE